MVPRDIPIITKAILDIERAAAAAEPPASHALPDFVTVSWVVRLIERAQLTPVDVVILRVLLAAEIEPVAYHALRRLAGDDTDPGVAVDALMTVMRAFGADTVDVLRSLRDTSPLVERGLVAVHGAGDAPAIVRRLTLPERLVDYVIDGEPPPPLVHPKLAVEPTEDATTLCPVAARDARSGASLTEQLRRVLPRVIEGETLWLTGAPGVGRKTLVAALAAELGLRLLVLSCEDALAVAPPHLVPMLWREVLLGDALLCVADADARLAGREARGEDGVTVPTGADALVGLCALLARANLPVVFTSDHAPPIQELERPPQVIRFGSAEPADVLALWRARLPDVERVEELATSFRLTPGRIVRTAAAAVQVAAAAGRERVEPHDVAQAISVSVSQQVEIVGTRVEDTQTWDDVVLPDDSLDACRELIARVRHRHTVLDEWGFRRKMAKGLGVAALFSGPPGTGKTMVAGLIARELGQDLYQIDLSRVVSKWIGETEKNLARVFDAAEGANVLLLFDEADALFTRRTEVKSSQDRHANAEVNYLLQRVERFEGVCILTTNLESSIDQAFKRRLAFRMTFPFPDETERARMWQRMLPSTAAVAPDIDFDELGAEYELAGGNIRNAVLRAAFLAASEQRPIDREILQRAVRLEYRDAGKFTTAGRIN